MTTARAVTVWLLVSAATAGAAGAARGPVELVLRDASSSGRAGTTGAAGATGVGPALVALCAVVLALALLRTWLVTTVTVAGVVTGTVRDAGRPVDRPTGATRRLVLLACGVAVVAGTAAPAAASDGREVVAGLALPERAVASPASPVADDDYVVRPGDSLWSIALAHPGAGGAGPDERWRAIWHANRDVVGDDPDLIHPGQALRLSDAPIPQDGDRR